MDFELLSDQPASPPTILQNLERLLTNRRRQFQLWSERPPQDLGFFIFFAVIAELVVAHRLSRRLGAGPAGVTQFCSLAVALFLVEWIVATIAHHAADFFGKKGSRRTELAFLNMSLAPLLLFLPFALVGSIDRRGETLLFFILVLLAFKVWSNWRDSVEAAYKFSRMQSGLVMAAVTAIAFVSVMIVFYASLMSRLAAALSDLG